MTNDQLIAARRRIDDITDQRMEKFEDSIKDVFSKINEIQKGVGSISNNIALYQGAVTPQLNRAKADIVELTLKLEGLTVNMNDSDELFKTKTVKIIKRIEPLEKIIKSGKKALVWFFAPLNIAGIAALFIWILGK